MMLTACKEEQQKPEAENVSNAEVLEVGAVEALNNKAVYEMTVHHKVKEQNIYVECIVTPDFQFTEKSNVKKSGEGHVEVYINNQKLGVYSQGAFILKDIPKGKHTVTLKLMHNDLTEYGVSKEFEVNI
jgi:hypothetical protein